MGLFGLGNKKDEEKEAQLKEASAKMFDAGVTSGMQTGVEVGKQVGAQELRQKQQTDLGNLGRGSQVNFVIPYFDVFDPRFQDCAAVPVAVHGVISYAVEDIALFNSLNKAEDMSDEVFGNKLKGTVTKYVKGCVSNAPMDCQIPVVQLERKIVEISDYVTAKVAPRVEAQYGIKVRVLDITKIVLDKESRGYRELQSMTADFERNKTTQMQQYELNKMKQAQDFDLTKTKQSQTFDLQNSETMQNMTLENTLLQHQVSKQQFQAQADLNLTATKLQQGNMMFNNNLQQQQSSLNLDAMKRQQDLNLGGQENLQKIQLENERENLRIQREEMQRASKLQTESTFLDAHQANMDFATNSKAMDKGINMNASSEAKTTGGVPPMPGMPQMPQVQYFVAVNGQQAGPFDMGQMQQLALQGQINAQTHVWCEGLANWTMAGQVPSLASLFGKQVPPPMPGGSIF